MAAAPHKFVAKADAPTKGSERHALLGWQMQFSVPLKKGHARNASPLLSQASNEASQASGENRASNGPPSARDAPRTSTEPRHRADAASMAWRKTPPPRPSPKIENNYTYREKASSAGESSCSAWADGDISIAK